MTNEEWLQSLTPGALVVIRDTSNAEGRWRSCIVSKVTKTQIVVGPRRFRKRDGVEVGAGPCFFPKIYPATPERIEAARRARAVAQFQGMVLEEQDIEEASTEHIEATIAFWEKGLEQQ